MPYTIDYIRDRIIPIAFKYGVASVGIFGSYARGDADENSDIDLVIDKGNMKSLLEYSGMIIELEDEFNCHVDLVIRSAIDDEGFKQAINNDEVNLYERG